MKPQATAGTKLRTLCNRKGRTNSSSIELIELRDSPAPLALDLHRALRSAGAPRLLRKTGCHPTYRTVKSH